MRERYDETWKLYPWEHPEAYWLRANESRAVCTRCGGAAFTGAGLENDHDAFGAAFFAWVQRHLACPIGFGLVSEPVRDPLFEGE